jgi:putative glutamine amidotransferase
MRPIIAITSGEILRSGDEWAPVVHGQSHTYIDAVIKAGGTPFLLPVTDNKDVLRQLYEKCDGILLSGGNDIDPSLYGAEKVFTGKSISNKRDKQELKFFKWALEDDKPVLGICRGLQLMNIALGGSLHQDILTNIPGSQDHEISAHQKDFSHIAHRLKIEPKSRLKQILNVDTIDTNALHHQAIDRLGKDLVPVAYAEDGVIEAVELPGKRFVIGVQSHPESLEATTEPLWFKLFQVFVNEAA